MFRFILAVLLAIACVAAVPSESQANGGFSRGRSVQVNRGRSFNRGFNNVHVGANFNRGFNFNHNVGFNRGFNFNVNRGFGYGHNAAFAFRAQVYRSAAFYAPPIVAAPIYTAPVLQAPVYQAPVFAPSCGVGAGYGVGLQAGGCQSFFGAGY